MANASYDSINGYPEFVRMEIYVDCKQSAAEDHASRGDVLKIRQNMYFFLKIFSLFLFVYLVENFSTITYVDVLFTNVRK